MCPDQHNRSTRRTSNEGKNSLANTTWNCKYYVALTQKKYRRIIIYGKYKQSIGRILRELREKTSVKLVAFSS